MIQMPVFKRELYPPKTEIDLGEGFFWRELTLPPLYVLSRCYSPPKTTFPLRRPEKIAALLKRKKNKICFQILEIGQFSPSQAKSV